MTTGTRTYVLLDRDGDTVAIVRDAMSQAHAIRAHQQRLGISARVASAEDALDAIAAGLAPFSAADPTADLRAARKVAHAFVEALIDRVMLPGEEKP